VFVVLLVILVILGIIIAVKKGSKNEAETPISTSEEGTKSYY